MELWQQHEQWAEREAEFCDKMVTTLLKSATDWQAKGLNKYTSLAAQNAFECSVRANTWQQMADALRRPRRIREEREAYDTASKATDA